MGYCRLVLAVQSHPRSRRWGKERILNPSWIMQLPVATESLGNAAASYRSLRALAAQYFGLHEPDAQGR